MNIITTASFSSVPLATTTTTRRRGSWIHLSEVQLRHREKERGESGKNEASSTRIQYHNLIRPSSPPDTTKWPSPHTLTALTSPQCAHADPAPHVGPPCSVIPSPLAPAAPPAAVASPPATACSAAGSRVLSMSTKTCNALPALVSFLHVLVTTGAHECGWECASVNAHTCALAAHPSEPKKSRIRPCHAECSHQKSHARRGLA